MSLSDEVKEMARLKVVIKAMDADLKDVKDRYKEQQFRVTEAMQSQDIQNMKVESDNGSFTAFQFNVIRARVSDEVAFEEWCASQDDMGGSVMFKMWSAQKLTSAVREILQQAESPLPKGIEVDEFTEVRLRKD